MFELVLLILAVAMFCRSYLFDPAPSEGSYPHTPPVLTSSQLDNRRAALRRREGISYKFIDNGSNTTILFSFDNRGFVDGFSLRVKANVCAYNYFNYGISRKKWGRHYLMTAQDLIDSGKSMLNHLRKIRPNDRIIVMGRRLTATNRFA